MFQSVNGSLSEPFCSCINRVSASWRQPFCTSSSWHRSAGSSQRPGSPTWQWQERFGPGSSASAFCVWAGVSKQHVPLYFFIISHHTSLLPFSLKVSGQGVFPSNCTSFFFFFFLLVVLILSVGLPDLHSVRLFVVMLLCSSQTLWGLSKWTWPSAVWGDRLVRLSQSRLQWPYVW